MNLDHYIDKLENMLLQYDRSGAIEVQKEVLNECSPVYFIEEVVVKTLISIGMKWENGEVALSQIYMGSKLCEEITDRLLPERSYDIKLSPPIGIVTFEDYHTLGKKIVKAMMRSAGFEMKDYGVMNSEEIIQNVINDGIKILMISVLMYPSALKIYDITKALKEKDPSIKILVGGAPFNIDKQLWKKVGACASGNNAADDIKIVENWIEGGSK